MKKPRNFSPRNYWIHKAAAWQPALSFRGETDEDFVAWKAVALKKFIALLGAFPQPVPLDPEIEYTVREGDIIRQRIVFDTEECMSVPCQVLYPADMKPDGTHPALVCCHGHGPGKDAVAGLASTPSVRAFIAEHNFDFGMQMARAGFFCICPELRGFGERKSEQLPPLYECDPCNADYVKATLMGIYPLTLNLWDIMKTIDYLETRAEVDKNRIGMMGISGGGTMTTFAAAYDTRIKAADIIGYVNPFAEFAICDDNACGMQVLPELFRYFDVHDIAGLIAPRPLLVEMGIYDNIFPFQDLIRGYEGIERIYSAAGAADKLESDIFPGVHAFGGNKAFAFFKEHLCRR
jgi:cephalosporin-C deacetylase-like acetyl esterase